MKRPYVSCPAGVNPTLSHVLGDIASSACLRWATSARNRASTSAGGSAGQRFDPRLVERPDVVADVGMGGLGDRRAAGAPTPSSIDSVPMRWAATACTFQPGRQRRPLPVVVVEPGEEGVEAGPDVVQGGDGLFLRHGGGHGGSLQGVGFWIVFQLRAVRYGRNVSAISSWSARCLGRWIS